MADNNNNNNNNNNTSTMTTAMANDNVPSAKQRRGGGGVGWRVVVVGLSFIHNSETSEIYISGGGRLKPGRGGSRAEWDFAVQRAAEVCLCACVRGRMQRVCAGAYREVRVTWLRRRRLMPPVER